MQQPSKDLILNAASHAAESRINWQPAQAQACGKTIVIGEHAVVYGARAVALPITTHAMHLHLVPDLQRPAHETKFYIGDKPLPEHVCGVVRDAFHCLGIEPIALTLRGKSQLPIGAGLGSSATLCVVVLRAIAAAAGLPLSQADLARHANTLERRFHGNPSGLDTSVVAFAQAIVFRKGDVPQPARVKGVWQFALIDSGLRAATMAMIHLAAPFFQGDQGAERIAAFDQLTTAVIAGLAETQYSRVAEAMNMSAELLKAAGVNTTELQELSRRAVQHGAVAAKMTGAGGGGTVLCLLPPDFSEQQFNFFAEQFKPCRVFKLALSDEHNHAH